VIRAGHLTRSERVEDTLLFSYSEDCPSENAVSLTMPVRTDQYDAAHNPNSASRSPRKTSMRF
jgi:hypothetical protein